MVVDFGNEISVEINERVQAMAAEIAALNIVGVTEIVLNVVNVSNSSKQYSL